MSNSINSSADSFLVNISLLQARLDRAQQQISSGLRVTKASDDPDQVGAILQATSDLARNLQIGHNLDRVKAEVDGSEQALSNAIATLERVSVLGAQGANFSQDAASRSQIAIEVQSLFERLVVDANTSVDNRFVFAGDSDQIAPYAIDLTTVTGTTPYEGSAATREMEDPRGGTFPISHSAQEIFDDPSASVFAAVNALRVALSTNDETAIGVSLDALKIAHGHLGDALSFYGTVQNEVADGSRAVSALTLRLTTTLTDLREADLAEASTELVTARFHLEAAFSARARSPHTSLFDYLG